MWVFGFCWPISTILSPLQFEVISALYLEWNLPPHLNQLLRYRVKCEQVCSFVENSHFCRGDCDAVLASTGPYYVPTPRVGGIKQWCASDVCLCVAYIGPKSRTVRPRKTKIGTEVAHITRDSDTTFDIKVKRLKVNLQRAGHIVAASRTACFYWMTSTWCNFSAFRAIFWNSAGQCSGLLLSWNCRTAAWRDDRLHHHHHHHHRHHHQFIKSHDKRTCLEWFPNVLLIITYTFVLPVVYFK